MLAQTFAVLNQMLDVLGQAKRAMIAAAGQFPEVRLLQTAPGVGIITACRFVAYIQTPARFSNKRKLWRYARLALDAPRIKRQKIGASTA
jgi:transposase